MSEALASAKRELRRRLGARRRAVTAAEAIRAGRAVLARLEGWAPFRQAPRVALYAALPDELPTRPVFEALVAAGRPALLPRIEAAGELGFRAVTRWEALRPGRQRVLEPPAELETVALAAGDLVLVPGVAFDPSGARLGRGGGAYDRAFAGEGGPVLCGVAHAFQLVESVPCDSHDRRMDAIVTDRGLHRITERA